jgi:NTE family protein
LAKTLGLALGTGGARGWAHVGIIRALEEANIKIDYIAGTSIGSLVGAIYLAGKLDALESFAQEAELSDFRSMLDISFPAPGLIKGEKVYDFIAKYVTDKRLEDTPIPFRCVATNCVRKQEVVLTTGLMADAVRASISIPGIFMPFKHREDVYLVDGGTMNPLPISVVRAMGADIVVAVNLNEDMSFDHPEVVTSSDNEEADQEAISSIAPDKSDNIGDASKLTNSPQADEDSAEDNVLDRMASRYADMKETLQEQADRWMPGDDIGISIFDVLGNSIDVMEKRVTEANLHVDKPDILIAPDLAEFGTFDFHKAQTIMPRGYKAGKAMVSAIQDLLES